MAWVVCSLIPGERLNLGPFARRLTSLVLRLFVRSVINLFVFSGLLVSSVLVAFRWLSVLAVLSLFWSSASSFWNLSLCSLLAMLYARYRWRRTFVAICGCRLFMDKLEQIALSSHCFISPYKRYVDNIYLQTANEEKANEFHDTINSLHPRLKFEVEKPTASPEGLSITTRLQSITTNDERWKLLWIL